MKNMVSPAALELDRMETLKDRFRYLRNDEPTMASGTRDDGDRCVSKLPDLLFVPRLFYSLEGGLEPRVRTISL